MTQTPAEGHDPAAGAQPGWAPPAPAAQPPAGWAPPPGWAPRSGYAPAPGYGPPPGYAPPPGYGPPPGWGTAPVWAHAAWPAGPGRPGTATAAAVLGFVACLWPVIATLAGVAAVADGELGGLVALLLGPLVATGLVLGGISLLHRGTRVWALRVAAGLQLLVVLVGFVGLLGWGGEDGAIGAVTMLLFTAPLPLLALVFSLRPTVRSWLAAAGPR